MYDASARAHAYAYARVQSETTGEVLDPAQQAHAVYRSVRLPRADEHVMRGICVRNLETIDERNSSIYLSRGIFENFSNIKIIRKLLLFSYIFVRKEKLIFELKHNQNRYKFSILITDIKTIIFFKYN